MEENQDTERLPDDRHPREDDRGEEVEQPPAPDPETGSTADEDTAAV